MIITNKTNFIDKYALYCKERLKVAKQEKIKKRKIANATMKVIKKRIASSIKSGELPKGVVKIKKYNDHEHLFGYYIFYGVDICDDPKLMECTDKTEIIKDKLHKIVAAGNQCTKHKIDCKGYNQQSDSSLLVPCKNGLLNEGYYITVDCINHR